MARVTVEDCLDNIENRFTMVLAASKRARQLSLGATPSLPPDNDKSTVIALREIAEGHLDEDGQLLASYQEEKPQQAENEEEIEIGRMSDEGDIAPTPEEEELIEKEQEQQSATQEDEHQDTSE